MIGPNLCHFQRLSSKRIRSGPASRVNCRRRGDFHHVSHDGAMVPSAPDDVPLQRAAAHGVSTEMQIKAETGGRMRREHIVTSAREQDLP